ncbi:MAG: toxin-antitoxin system HicB family antitoxin [Eubacteriaceae bacterium]|nr:toxin-antitoxin system HicB family antitoxin [Eubacteriaceae bacterium]
MKNNLLEYKKYYGTVEYSAEDDCLTGKIVNVDDLVMYSGDSLDELKKAFQEMVDGEIADQKKKEYKGSLNIRLKTGQHEELALYAAGHHTSINSVIREAVLQLLEKDSD